ncbi:MAG TPA: hypothetical protein PLZ46_07285, partial [Bacteroidales bacterium]|nr:hypothetical protein [Bacteroidales bacterium]
WDNVVANAPIGSYKVLHLYQKRNFLKLASNFPSAAQCCVWNKNTNTYRVVELFYETKTIIFEEGESFVNSHDGSEYLCVVYSGSWVSPSYFYKLPVVYVNSRDCSTLHPYKDHNANGLFVPSENVPLLRGVDCYSLYRIYIHPSLEHLSFLTLYTVIQIDGARGGDVQGRILMNIYDAKPKNTPMSITANTSTVINFSNLDLADDFYTKISVFPYSYASNTFYDFPTRNNARRFKFDSSFNLRYSAGYVGGIPSAEILEGTITENQEYTAGVGCHGFNKSDWTVLRNFPMWTVLDGAYTGCLRPAASASSYANFIFYSNQLEGKYFAKFDANGNIDLDPTNTFVANLPFLPGNVAQKITFEDKTFVNQFTPAEQDAIEDLVVNQKKWILEWK